MDCASCGFLSCFAPFPIIYFRGKTLSYPPVRILGTTSYQHLESEVTPHLEFSQMTDFGQLLDVFWNTSLQMRYFLQEHYRTKIQYNYTPDLLDFTVLAGWFNKTSKSKDLHIIATEKLEKEMNDMQNHFDSQVTNKYSAEKFFNTYIDSKTLVPIVVRTNEGIIMDSDTLFFFLMILHGCPDPVNPVLKKRDDIIQTMRVKIGEKFESWLRAEIRNRGYAGPNVPIRVPQKTGFEYDLIAISEDTKTIIMADAKYRDMSPSSFTGANLIAQELLGDHGLLSEAEQQQKRLDYFRENADKFKEHLNPKLHWEDYNVQSFLVTKQTPLAHRYKEVVILRSNEFFQTLG